MSGQQKRQIAWSALVTAVIALLGLVVWMHESHHAANAAKAKSDLAAAHAEMQTRIQGLEEKMTFMREELVRRGVLVEDYNQLKERVRFLERAVGSTRSPSHDFRGVR